MNDLSASYTFTQVQITSIRNDLSNSIRMQLDGLIKSLIGEVVLNSSK